MPSGEVERPAQPHPGKGSRKPRPSPLVARFHALMKSRYAYPALFAGALLESTFFPWPIEFVLAAMMLDDRRHVLPVTTIAIIGSVIGGVIFFFIGSVLFESVGAPMVSALGMEEAFELKRQRFQDYSIWIIFVAAQTPVPFQITTMAAGVAGVAFWPFFTAALLARTVRYAMMGGVLYFFGPRLRCWWQGLPRLVRRAAPWVLLIVFFLALVLPFA